MSSIAFTEEDDNLLLGSSWLGKKDQHGKTHLFKYSSKPDNQSFVLLTTNLESIYTHTPLPEDIPAVPWEVDHPFLLSTQDLIRDEFSDEPMEQVPGLVERIRLMIEERWDEVQLLVEVEDEAKVVYMRIDDFAWRFTLTELPSPQILPTITRHLLQPSITIIANDRSIPIPTTSSRLSSFESSCRLISDPEIMRAITRSTVKPKTVSGSSSSSQSRLPSSSQIPSSSQSQGSPTPRKPARSKPLNRHHNDPDRKEKREVRRSTPTPANPSSSSSMPPSSPPKLPSSRQPTSSIPPEQPDFPSSSPLPPQIPSSSATSSPLKVPKSSSRPIDQSSSPSVGSAMDFKPPTQSLPVKTKREREKEEEESMERKMKEMKKKMEKGGTGKLGKRRLAR